MKRFNLQIAIACVVGLAAHAAHAQTVYEFTNTGPATWYNTANWSSALVPSSDFGELGSVDLGRSAFVDTAMADGTFAGQSANPGAVRVGFLASIGTVSLLEIRNGGTFRVQPDAGAVTNGGVTVGAANGTGTLRVLPGGTMTVDGPLFEDVIVTPGNAQSRVEIGAATGAGTATMNVGSANINGVLQPFANSDFNSLSTLSFGGGAVFRPEVKSASNAKVDVTGVATLAGTMTVDFNGFTPSFGNSWTVMEASSLSGNFAAVNSPTLGLGQNLVQSKVPVAGRQQLRVTYTSSLVLTVNRDSGAMALSNPNSPNISMDGYSVRSASGKLDPVAWTSLHDLGALGGDWRESNASGNQLAELKPTTSGTINGNTNQTMGNAYNPMASAFASPEDLIFDYTQPDGSVVTGTVVYSGTRVNNLLMQVDPSNGHTILKNTSQTTVSIDGYDVASAGGSLSTTNWNSLDDQNTAGGDWRESDASSNHLAELKPTAATSLAPGASFDLGHPFNTAIGTQDLVFNFLQSSSATPTLGVVLYAPIAGNVLGDYNGNGVVDAADYTVWRDHLGQTFTLPNRNPLNSGPISVADYTYWKSRFGAISGSGSGSLSGGSVPEPSSWLMLAIGGVFCLVRRQRK